MAFNSSPLLEDWFTKESYREGGAQLVLLKNASKKPQRCLSSWQERRWKSMLWVVSTSWGRAPEGTAPTSVRSFKGHSETSWIYCKICSWRAASLAQRIRLWRSVILSCCFEGTEAWPLPTAQCSSSGKLPPSTEAWVVGSSSPTRVCTGILE